MSATEPTIADVKTSVDGLGNALSEFKLTQKQSEKETLDHGHILSLTNLKLQALADEMVKHEESLVAIAAKQDRPENGDKEADEENERKSGLMNEYLRKGLAGISGETKDALIADHAKHPAFMSKDLTESVNPTAGFLVRDEQSDEIITSVTEFSPIRQIARVISIGSMAWEGPKRTAQFSASWVSETGTRAETTGLAFGMERIPVHELHARVDMSNALMEDSFVNLEAFLNVEFAERFAVAEGTAFVTGTGIGRPEGFNVNTATVAGATTSGTVGALDADDFSSLLIGALQEPYHPNSTWVMNRTTLRDAMQLKDGNGQFIWQPGLAAGIPGAILGRPFILATDMPAVATGAEALAIGDFRRGYMIVDRIGINVRRIEDTQTASAGGIAIFARKRVGAQVVNAEAIKLLTIQ